MYNYGLLIISVSHFEVHNDSNNNSKEISPVTKGLDHITLEDNERQEYQKFGETSSVENKVVVEKPKKGVMKTFNRVLSRLFVSRP